MIGELSPWHLLILAAVILVLFGAKKLPDSARSLGRAMRIFKSETSGLRGDHGDHDDAQAQAAPQQLPAAQQPATQAGDGTTVNGEPLADPQRTSQPS